MSFISPSLTLLQFSTFVQTRTCIKKVDSFIRDSSIMAFPILFFRSNYQFLTDSIESTTMGALPLPDITRILWIVLVAPVNMIDACTRLIYRCRRGAISEKRIETWGHKEIIIYNGCHKGTEQPSYQKLSALLHSVLLSYSAFRKALRVSEKKRFIWSIMYNMDRFVLTDIGPFKCWSFSRLHPSSLAPWLQPHQSCCQ